LASAPWQKHVGSEMRHITQDGIDLIKRFEGFSPTVYICPAGYPTIGYGHLVREAEQYEQGVTKAEAEELLRRDVQMAEKAVLRLIDVPLTDGQFDALVSFTFNLGAGALQRSTLRRKVNRQTHSEVPEQFMRWVWAGGQKMIGLVKRRGCEAIMYSSNDLKIHFNEQTR